MCRRPYLVAELCRCLAVHLEPVLERDRAIDNGLEGSLERVNQVDTRRGKVRRRALFVALHDGQPPLVVGKVSRDRSLARVEDLERLLRERRDRDARGDRDALLRGADDDVDLPVVHADLFGRDGADTVEDDERVGRDAANRLGDGLGVGEDARRCGQVLALLDRLSMVNREERLTGVDVSKSQDRVLFLLQRRLDLVERRPSADRSANLVDLGTVGLEAVGKAARSGRFSSVLLKRECSRRMNAGDGAARRQTATRGLTHLQNSQC